MGWPGKKEGMNIMPMDEGTCGPTGLWRCTRESDMLQPIKIARAGLQNT